MLSFLVDCSSSSCLGMPCWLMHNLPVVVGNSTHSLSLLLVLPLCTSLHFPSCVHRPPLIYAIAHSFAHPTKRHTPTHTSAHLPCLLSRSFIYPPLSTCLLTYLLIHDDKHHLTASTSHEHVCWSRHVSRTPACLFITWLQVLLSHVRGQYSKHSAPSTVPFQKQ